MLPYVTWTGSPVFSFRSSTIFHLTVFLRLPSPQGTILLMVRRYVALCCTKRREVRHPVRVVALPVTDVVHGEGPFRAPAKQASVPVPVEDCVPQGVQPAAGPRLVVRPFRGRPSRLYRLEELRIEGPGLRCDADYGTDLQVLHYYADMQVLLMLHRRGKPPLRLFPVVKTGLSVTEPVPPCPAVTPSVVMALLLIRKGVVLGMHELTPICLSPVSRQISTGCVSSFSAYSSFTVKG